MIDMHQTAFIFKTLYALLLGLILGIDPERRGRPAGIRTHMLICGASCALLLAGVGVIRFYQGETAGSIISTDPLRIIQAIIVGISFVGAGSILQRPKEEMVQGLTTAAGLIFTSAVGIIAAVEQYVVAGALSFIVLLTMTTLRPLKKWISKHAAD